MKSQPEALERSWRIYLLWAWSTWPLPNFSGLLHCGCNQNRKDIVAGSHFQAKKHVKWHIKILSAGCILENRYLYQIWQFFWLHLWQFLGQGLYLRHSSDLGCCDNARSLTYYATRELQVWYF